MKIKANKNLRFKLSSKSIVIPDLKRTIRENSDLHQGYVANIAMAFKDEVYRYKQKNNKTYLNSNDIHIIANKAAEHFMLLWILEECEIEEFIEEEAQLLIE